jgi:hypothetical protein
MREHLFLVVVEEIGSKNDAAANGEHDALTDSSPRRLQRCPAGRSVTIA